MSVEFSNAYQDILLDNLMSIIKQNFVFQTQIKLSESTGIQKAELEKQYNQLLEKFNSIQPLITEYNVIKDKNFANTTAIQEKDRIQTAYNDELKKHGETKKKLVEKDAEIEKLQLYIVKLEENIPASKMKKISPEKVNVVVPEEPDKNLLNDGSSF